jgi:hypothetical protein
MASLICPTVANQAGVTAPSDTECFVEGAHLESVGNERGAVTHLMIQAVEGYFKASHT